MPRLLQINAAVNYGSIGRITESISYLAKRKGWECYLIHGSRYKNLPSSMITYQPGSVIDEYFHYAEHLIFDNDGLASRNATRRIINKIKEISPDIIHLHDIHDHWLNYKILFEYLDTLDTPIVWTQHDCWAFTGGCVYFDNIDCDKWKSECNKCTLKRVFFIDKTKKHFNNKKELLSKLKSLTFVSVSDWLGDIIKTSVHSYRSILTIHNGIDLNKFKPSSFPKTDKFQILGVALPWSKRKGLDDFVKLRNILDDTYEITLVGLNKEQLKNLPIGIKGIIRTSNIEELAQLYSASDVFVNPTYSDNFPTVNLEALACGTPVITYKTGGSPEAIDEKTGIVVEQGNVVKLADAIKQIRKIPLSSKDCRKRAEQLFDKEKCFEKYIELYYELLNK